MFGPFEHAFGDRLHRRTPVHRGLLDPAERIRLGHAVNGLKPALGTIDDLARLETLLKITDLGLESRELLVTTHRNLDRGQEVALLERLDEISHRPGVDRPLHELPL